MNVDGAPGPHAQFTRWTVTGYVLMAVTQYSVFAPLYLLRVLLNWRRLRAARRNFP